MISFPNAKINLGLSVVEKRPDNFHNIETVFLPIGLKEILEVVYNRSGNEAYVWNNTGVIIHDAAKNNICIKALDFIRADHNIGPVQVHLHKDIPIGAGLGGGSADGAFMLMLLNELFELELTKEQLKSYAARLGADCPLFIDNTPQYATGIGDILEPVKLNLSGYYFVLIVPDIHVSTPEAYQYVTPQKPEFRVRDVIKMPLSEWRNKLKNDFEESVFKQFPEIKKIKDYLYSRGAVYASMSGSGSSVFGFFKDTPEIEWDNSFVWTDKL